MNVFSRLARVDNSRRSELTPTFNSHLRLARAYFVILNTKRVILAEKGWRRLKRIGNDDLERLSQYFSKYTNGDRTSVRYWRPN